MILQYIQVLVSLRLIAPQELCLDVCVCMSFLTQQELNYLHGIYAAVSEHESQRVEKWMWSCPLLSTRRSSFSLSGQGSWPKR